MAAVCVLAISTAAIWYFLATGSRVNQIAEAALQAIDARDYLVAAQQAELLARVRHPDASSRSTAAFVLGACGLHQANLAEGILQRRQAVAAAAFLEQSRRLGFPPGREVLGLELLGRSQFLAQNYQAAHRDLDAALAAGAQPVVELRQLAAKAALQMPSPLPRVALDHLRAALATPGLTQEQRIAIALYQAQVQCAHDDWEGCRKTMESLPESSHQDAAYCLLAGKLLFHDAAERSRSVLDHPTAAAEAHALYRQAMEIFRRGLLDRECEDMLVAELTHGLACAHRGLGQSDAAIQQLRRIQTAFSEQRLALNATLDEADLLLDRRDYAAFLAVYRQALDRVSRAVDDDADVEKRMFIERSLANLERLQQGEAYSEAVALIQAARPLISPTRYWELLAQMLLAWGEHLQQQALMAKSRKSLPIAERIETHLAIASANDPPVAAHNSSLRTALPTKSLVGAAAQLSSDNARPGEGSDREDLWRQARQRFREAGRAFAMLAGLRRAAPEFPGDLWASAQAYKAARDYPAAIGMLQGYLEHERPGKRQAEALNLMGETWLAEGNAEQAVQALQQVLDLYPRHPAKYASRLLLGQAWLELGEPTKAAAVLEENLQGDDLTPASPEWRASLFALAQLRYGEQQWSAAIPLFEQAVARYPRDADAPQAWYLLGECYAQRARERADEFSAPLATALRERTHAVQQLYNQALDALDHGLSLLHAFEAERELSLSDAAIMRNALFARASVLMQLGQRQLALDAYASLINRYQRTPAVLDAYVQTAAIYRDQKQFAEAKNAVAAGRNALERLPAESDLRALTGMNKAEWERYLEWLAGL